MPSDAIEDLDAVRMQLQAANNLMESNEGQTTFAYYDAEEISATLEELKSRSAKLFETMKREVLQLERASARHGFRTP